jgi:hypothetical protein
MEACIVDCTAHITWRNAAFRTLATPADQLNLGDPLDTLRARDSVANERWMHLRSGRIVHAPIRVSCANGEARQLRQNLSPMLDRENRLTHVVAVHYPDIVDG